MEKKKYFEFYVPQYYFRPQNSLRKGCLFFQHLIFLEKSFGMFDSQIKTFQH